MTEVRPTPLEQLERALDAGLIDQDTFDAAVAVMSAELTDPGAITQGQGGTGVGARSVAVEGDKESVFVSYSHRDARSLDDFRNAVRRLDLDDRLTVWDDTTVQPGSTWADQVERRLESARVIVLLVSPSFLASDFIRECELSEIMRRAQRGGATVVPVMLSTTVMPPELATLQALPSEGGSIADQPDRRQAWADVANAIVRIVSGPEDRDWQRPPQHLVEPDRPLDTGQVVRALKRAGFKVQERKGALYVLRDDSDPARVVAVPRRAAAIRGSLLRQILSTAGLSEREFEALLSGP